MVLSAGGAGAQSGGMTEDGTIVVGVDGSRASKEALRWAIGEATRRGCAVEAIEVWHYPALTYVPGVYTAPVFAHDELDAAAQASLDHAVDEVLAGDGEGRVEVSRTVLEGSATEKLVERSKDASLLVLGNRGRGGFRGLLLGSVAHQCTVHAGCPVVIVPQPPEDGVAA